MRAVVYDPEARANLRLAHIDEPVATESEALVEVRATALNFGEVHFIDRMCKPGEVPGWDAAGLVVQAAANGSGPPVGSRVVGFHGAGGWAERRAVPTENLAVLPDSVDFGAAAALPVAGVTALQDLRAPVRM
jgi:NADPH:quinone reductase-like Zn-dependent oxidoreductase